MDPSNENDEQITNRLKKLNWLKYSCFAFMLIVTVVNFTLFNDAEKFFDPNNARKTLIMDSCVTFVFILVHIYLIDMAFQQQKLFRQFGHVSGYYGEALVLITYLLIMLAVVAFNILQRIVVFLISSSDYKCSQTIVDLS